jgi:LmbE family N-acetylglucosaminyl deacetylase
MKGDGLMRVLAIGAHPDDVEVLCSGTLALCAARGDEVTIAVATNGDVGTGEPGVSRDEIAAIRHSEAAASAATIGASLIWMGFPDEFLNDDRESRERFIDAIREARPELMFIHSEIDYHPDHRVAGKISRDSRIPVSVPLVTTHFPPTEIPTMFVMDTVAGRHFEPEIYVDISSVIEIKTAMLNSHKSQADWIRRVFDTDLAEGMLLQARFRGYQAGCQFAEGFRLLHDWPYTGDHKLLP